MLNICCLAVGLQHQVMMHWFSTYVFVMIAKNDIEWNIDCNVCKLVFTVFMKVSDVEILTAT